MNTEATRMDREMIDTYSDYLITNFGQATAISLSNVLGGELGHDSITKALADRGLTSKGYWKLIKPTIREIQDENASLFFAPRQHLTGLGRSIDGLIVEKQHSDESGMIAYYFNHTKRRNVKGINIVDASYVAPKARVPMDFVVVKKLGYRVDLQGKPLRQQTQTKHEILEDIVRFAVLNEVPFKSVLFDVWNGSAANMRLVKIDVKKETIKPLKEARKVKLLETASSTLKAVESLELVEAKPNLARLEGLPFEIRVAKLDFKQMDGPKGVLFLCSSEPGLSGEEIRLGYQKRWPVEEQHKNGTQNTGLGSSHASLVAARGNHVFCSFVRVLKLACLKLQTGLNHFALNAKLRLKAVQAAREELIWLQAVHSDLLAKAAQVQ
jgi:hypothetical protein